MKKRLLVAGSAIVGLVLALALGLWLFFDANQFRPALESAMGDALGRKVSIGNIRIALLSGGLAVDNLSIADDPAFSHEPFVTAKAVTVGVDLMPLIFSRSLRVESFRLEQPQVVLLRAASGLWNFSGLGASSGTRTSGPATAMSVFIQKVTIANGRVVVGRSAAGGHQRAYEDVNAEVTNLSLTSEFPFHITAKMPGGGTAGIDGRAGPVNLKNAAETPFRATVDVKRLDIASTGFIDPGSGLGGVIGFSSAVASDGRVTNAKGKVNAASLQLVPASSPSRVPIEIDYELDYNPRTSTGVVKQGDVHVGKAVARLTGSYDARGEKAAVRMKLSGQRMPVTELEAALPAIGVKLPAGASLRQGTLDADFSISGPIDRLVITGPINLSNATLAGFDLGDKMAAVASLANLPKSGETIIETLASTFRVAPDGIKVDSLNLVVPAIGNLTGAGTIGPKDVLNFQMLAKLSGGGALVGSVARVASLGQAANQIPFRIQGTTANPMFVPDVGRAVGNVMKNPETATKAAEALGGLFGRKKR